MIEAIVIAFLCVIILFALRKVARMIADLISQLTRLRDEIIPALTSAFATIASLKADNATLTARVAELEAEVNGLPQAISDLAGLNDQIAALVPAAA